MNNKSNNTMNNKMLSTSTPNRELDSKIRTPVNRSSAFEWSPNVQFATPIVNSPSLELPRTPVMLASLGIQPEADIDMSWQSCMATPSSVTEGMGTTVYHTPTDIAEDKSKIQQLKTPVLATNSIRNRSVKEKLDTIERRLPMIPEGAQANASFHSSETCSSKNQNSVLGLFIKKAATKFIYPKPVFIQMKPNGPSTSGPAQVCKASSVHEVPESEDIAPSPVISQRQPRKKKARKNLHFSEFPSSGSSVHSEESCDSTDTCQSKSTLIEQCNNNHHSISSPEIKHSSTLFGFTKMPDIDEQEENENGMAYDKCAFNTASGRQIHVSDNALVRAKSLFLDVESEPVVPDHCAVQESNEPGANRIDMLNAHVYAENDPFDDQKRLNKPIDGGNKFTQTSDACGLLGKFGTTGGKQMAVSEQRLLETRKSDWNDLVDTKDTSNFAQSKHVSTSSSAMIGFSTASGKNVAISSKALDRARKMFDDCDQSKETSKSKVPGNLHSPVISSTKTVGFSTAAGKEVSISAEALTRAKKTFDDCQSDGIHTNARHTSISTPACPSTAGFSTASGKGLAISAKSLARAKQMFEDCDSDSGKKMINAPSTTVPSAMGSSATAGFSTASGKGVVVSAKALARGKQIFEDCRFVTGQEAGHSAPRLADPSTQIARTSGAVGFNTASGKGVAITSGSLARAKKMFEECQTENSKDEKNTVHNSSRGSGNRHSATSVRSTGGVGCNSVSGKGVAVESLGRAKQFPEKSSSETSQEHEDLWNGPSTCVPTSAGNSRVPGFSTASGKGVAVSAESLARAKQFYENFHQESDGEGQCVATTVASTDRPAGFSTASGKNVKISSQALARAKNMFMEENKERGQPSPCSKQLSASGNVQEDVGHRKRKKEEESDSDRSPSPTIGKKKRKDSPLTANSHELQLTQTQFSIWDVDPTCVGQEILTARRRARQCQRSLIEAKKNRRFKVAPNPGALYRMKKNSSVKRKTLAQFASSLLGRTSLSPALPPDELMSKGLLASVCSIHSGNAASFKFYGWDYFSLESCRSNAQGFQLGEFQLILADDNTIGCDEISASFLASSNVDPSLVTEDWIKNHYRWIVWKLASMEQRFPELLSQQCLNPAGVLEQLKYRYDREIDGCQRSALRRIIEQDDTPAKTMILCVSAVCDASNTPTATLELTDGWYFIRAQIDPFLKHLVDRGKIFAGLKLIISGAELVAPGPSSPLETGPDTYLKISANSVRRARWSSRLGFYVNPQPFPVSLRSILPEGGLVSLVRVLVARIYPLVFMEKTAEGKTLFRSERYYRKAMESVASDYERMMEKMMDDIERETDEQERRSRRINGSRSDLNLTDEEKRRKIQLEAQKRMEQLLSQRKKSEGVAVLRMRLVDWQSNDSTSAVLSVWRPSDDLRSMIKENCAYRLYHVTTSGLRFGEIQLNSVKNTRWDEIKNSEDNRNQTVMASAPQFHATGFQRRVTSFQAVCQRGFKPPFNELDSVGLVVHVVRPPNKNSFQTAVLYDGTTYFAIKCWGGFDDYALDDVIVTGAFLAFSNLNWRTNSSSGRMPSAFIGEATVVSSRPAAKHLDQALSHLKQLLSDPAACVAEAEPHLAQLLSNNGTPSTSTPNQSMNDVKKGLITPTYSTDGKKETPSSTQSSSRSRLLEKYGPPPSLFPLHITPSNTVRQRFKPPAKKSPAV